MCHAVGEYVDWRHVNYQPAIAEMLPLSLLPYLSSGQSAVEIGCNTGRVALYLGRQGLNVLGVDLNPAAINIAHESATSEGMESKLRFMVADVIKDEIVGDFDLVLMIRVLTCFPSPQHWRLLLNRTYSLLKPGGIIYINDFMLTEENDLYRKRYEAGARQGWRYGNFTVPDAAGNLLFIAHHHPEEELKEIVFPYSQLRLHFYYSHSMNGNECRMFEFIGQKPCSKSFLASALT